MNRAIFIVKPIIDLLHEDAIQSKTEISQLKDRIIELEKEIAHLKSVMSTPIKPEPIKPEPIKPEPIKIDIPMEAPVKEKPRGKPRVAPIKPAVIDEEYKKEAETFQDRTIENTEKVVVLEKTKSELQKEYQRNYRKLKKESQAINHVISKS
jgi:cell division septum initiation protein DivIVA